MTDTVRDIYLSNASQRKMWKNFLLSLGIQNFHETETMGIERTIGLFNGERLVGTGSIAGNTIKYIAVCDQGEETKGARFNKVITILENQMAESGKFHHFVFTKPKYVNTFQHIGFDILATSDYGAILEKGSPGIVEFLDGIPKCKREMNKVAAIVVNANPFTLGHRFLIEEAAKENDLVYVFVVNQDVSLFNSNERIYLVRSGVADLNNVIVTSGGDYMVSYLTFPSYFISDAKTVVDYQTTLDARIFKNIVAPALHITCRYVGSEPLSPTTNKYNQTLKRELNPGIEVVEVVRVKVKGEDEIISARTVRKAIAQNKPKVWKNLVPESTDRFIKEHMSILQERIRKGQKINGN